MCSPTPSDWALAWVRSRASGSMSTASTCALPDSARASPPKPQPRSATHGRPAKRRAVCAATAAELACSSRGRAKNMRAAVGNLAAASRRRRASSTSAAACPAGSRRRSLVSVESSSASVGGQAVSGANQEAACSVCSQRSSAGVRVMPPTPRVVCPAPCQGGGCHKASPGAGGHGRLSPRPRRTLRRFLPSVRRRST